MMNDKEPEVMRILHKIREEQYEETKDLPVSEWVKKIREEAEECKKKYGVKLPMRVRVKK
ncbi:MAG: hypothetical protein AB1546_08225 [bacterium]